jgi:hypothetical protein
VHSQQRGLEYVFQQPDAVNVVHHIDFAAGNTEAASQVATGWDLLVVSVLPTGDPVLAAAVLAITKDTIDNVRCAGINEVQTGAAQMACAMSAGMQS